MDRCSDAGGMSGGNLLGVRLLSEMETKSWVIPRRWLPAACGRENICCSASVRSSHGNDLDLRDATCLPSCDTKLYGNCMWGAVETASPLTHCAAMRTEGRENHQTRPQMQHLKVAERDHVFPSTGKSLHLFKSGVLNEYLNWTHCFVIFFQSTGCREENEL